jgi:hypothetical protein
LQGCYEPAKSCSYQDPEHGPADDVERVVHADIDAGEADREGEQEERRPPPRPREREHRRRGEARRRMSGRKGAVGRRVHERARLGVARRGTLLAEDGLEQGRDDVGDGDRAEGDDEDAVPLPHQSQDSGDHDPDEPEPADPREILEDRVERACAVVDDPALEVAVRPDQGA